MCMKSISQISNSSLSSLSEAITTGFSELYFGVNRTSESVLWPCFCNSWFMHLIILSVGHGLMDVQWWRVRNFRVSVETGLFLVQIRALPFIKWLNCWISNLVFLPETNCWVSIASFTKVIIWVNVSLGHDWGLAAAGPFKDGFSGNVSKMTSLKHQSSSTVLSLNSC